MSNDNLQDQPAAAGAKPSVDDVSFMFHYGARDGSRELAVMKKKLAEMEQEAAKLRTMQQQVEKQLGGNPTATAVSGAPASSLPGEVPVVASNEVDSRSIYVGNVEYAATPEDLQAHFKDCGEVNRVTIICDRVSGTPKGYGYIEFTEPEMAQKALALHEVEFQGRPLKVVPKRTNIAGVGRGRGRRPYRGGFRGRGGGFR
ncbi:hypothetical protein IWQ60_005320 [Tieghemiomyces parasiticus]|uniref:RRM domain-containing protein n=1 Tax=Tieghemiomyces parasiticus TaxID=78921 RepID=A0A9W8A6B8_9FUNG|nr:hypothetical protein IWQ60_005320 [Tieghemiomyces parasiticus]